MDILLSIGALFFVFIAIGFCIFSHELGHFLAAKWRGMHIDAFSLGFRPFWKKKINGVEYRLGWLPFGGYVELPQVDATDAVPKAADGTILSGMASGATVADLNIPSNNDSALNVQGPLSEIQSKFKFDGGKTVRAVITVKKIADE